MWQTGSGHWGLIGLLGQRRLFVLTCGGGTTVRLHMVTGSVMVRVACWMLFACLCFSIMNGIVRHLGGVIEPIVVVFFRC